MEAPSQPPSLALAMVTRYMTPGGGQRPVAPVSGAVVARGRPAFLSTPLSRVMKANGHTAASLARHLGCGQRTVEYWTTGEKVIPPRYVPKLVDLYGRSAEYFRVDDWHDVVVDDEARRVAEEFFSYSEDCDEGQSSS